MIILCYATFLLRLEQDSPVLNKLHFMLVIPEIPLPQEKHISKWLRDFIFSQDMSPRIYSRICPSPRIPFDAKDTGQRWPFRSPRPISKETIYGALCKVTWVTRWKCWNRMRAIFMVSGSSFVTWFDLAPHSSLWQLDFSDPARKQKPRSRVVVYLQALPHCPQGI